MSRNVLPLRVQRKQGQGEEMGQRVQDSAIMLARLLEDAAEAHRIDWQSRGPPFLFRESHSPSLWPAREPGRNAQTSTATLNVLARTTLTSPEGPNCTQSQFGHVPAIRTTRHTSNSCFCRLCWSTTNKNLPQENNQLPSIFDMHMSGTTQHRPHTALHPLRPSTMQVG